MEVAEEIGISQAQVSRLEKDAINRIRKSYKWELENWYSDSCFLYYRR